MFISTTSRTSCCSRSARSSRIRLLIGNVSGNIILFSVVGFLAVAAQGCLTWGLLAAAIAGAALLSKFNVGVGCVGAVFAWLMLVHSANRGTDVGEEGRGHAGDAVTVAVGYAAAEGKFQDLLAFLRYSFVIAGDYSTQMSNKGPMWQVALMAGLVTAVVGYVFAGARLDWKTQDIAAIVYPSSSAPECHRAASGGHLHRGFSATSALPIFLMVADSCRVGRAETGVRCFVAVMLFSGLSGFVASGPTPAMIVAVRDRRAVGLSGSSRTSGTRRVRAGSGHSCSGRESSPVYSWRSPGRPLFAGHRGVAELPRIGEAPAAGQPAGVCST